jgi:hypothetical protein
MDAAGECFVYDEMMERTTRRSTMKMRKMPYWQHKSWPIT